MLRSLPYFSDYTTKELEQLNTTAKLVEYPQNTVSGVGNKLEWEIPHVTLAISWTTSAFHSINNSALNLRKFPVTNGTQFGEFSVKRTALRDMLKFAEISCREFPFYL